MFRLHCYQLAFPAGPSLESSYSFSQSFDLQITSASTFSVQVWFLPAVCAKRKLPTLTVSK